MVSFARVLLISIALMIAFFSVKYTFANLAYLKVDSYLNRWSISKEPTQLALDDALASSKTMLTLHGHHPHYLNMAAKVYEWQAYKNSQDAVVVKQSLQRALTLYSKSTVLRKHWPLTWSYMSVVKAKLGMFDDEFYRYIDNAIKYGPYTKEVNLQVSKFFLVYWGQLPGLSMAVGLEQINRTLSNASVRFNLLNYSKSIGKARVVCAVGNLKKIGAVSQSYICRSLK